MARGCGDGGEGLLARLPLWVPRRMAAATSAAEAARMTAVLRFMDGKNARRGSKFSEKSPAEKINDIVWMVTSRGRVIGLYARALAREFRGTLLGAGVAVGLGALIIWVSVPRPPFATAVL